MLVLGYSHGPHGVSHHQAMDVSEDAMQDVRTTWTDDGQGCLERPGIGDIRGYPSYLKIENDCLVVWIHGHFMTFHILGIGIL